MIIRLIEKINIPQKTAVIIHTLMGQSFPAFVEYASKYAHRKYDGIIFETPSALADWRGQTHLTKEPATIEWINQFKPNDVFFDIGANIGVYSLYASIHKQARVFAFEPSPFNFSTLCRNVILNNISDYLSPFCVALSNKTVIDHLHMSSVQSGAAHTGFQKAVNEFGGALQTVHAQATLGFTLDDFIRIFKTPVPNHIKIDVDGAEPYVLAGMAKTLENPVLTSILIELPARDNNNLPPLLFDIISHGFRIQREDHPDGDTRLTNYILSRG
ncbi:MAG: FkbM family methyltransferase [Alphaproteobacteria bacterium]|nr:FkbM family methyltransferase [Alphaproteobacteria bacterium]